MSTPVKTEEDGEEEEEDEEETYGYEDDDYYNDNEDEDVDEANVVNITSDVCPKLSEDFQELKTICIDAKLQPFPSLDEVQVEFPLPTSVVEEKTRQVLGLTADTIGVRLVFPSDYLDGSDAIRILVYENQKDNEPTMKDQLKNILTTFTEKKAKLVVEAKVLPSSTPPPQPVAVAESDKAGAEEDSGIPDVKIPKLDDPVESNQLESTDVQCGFLLQLYHYACDRLKSLPSFCIICDRRHPAINQPNLEQRVCNLPLCALTYKKSGWSNTVAIVTQAAEEQDAKVVDLLIALAKASAMSSRWEVIFKPYPAVLHPEKSQEFAFKPEDRGTLLQVRSVLSKFGDMKGMTRLLQDELKTHLDNVDILLHPLLLWLVSSVESHLISLRPHQHLTFIPTPHQFFMKSSAPAKESKFAEAKESHGSTFAFHGSSLENWHGIIRSGLLNASGTNLQLNGAEQGAGVYLTPQASFAVMYCNYREAADRSALTSHGGKSEERQGEQNTSNAQIVTSGDLKKISDNVWLTPNAEDVITRFIFVFEDTDFRKSSVRSDDPLVLAEVRHAAQ